MDGWLSVSFLLVRDALFNDRVSDSYKVLLLAWKIDKNLKNLLRRYIHWKRDKIDKEILKKNKIAQLFLKIAQIMVLTTKTEPEIHKRLKRCHTF